MNPLHVYNAIQRDPNLAFARDTLAHILSIFDTYGSANVSLCFNGGKDCTVLLHLLAAALAHRGVSTGLASIPVVYFKFEEELPELDVFLSDCCRLYRFPLLTVTGATMKDCVSSLLAQRPRTRAMFMGQRVGDPGSASLSLVSPSDPTWPPLDRVNSILHWSYQQVWTFLLSLRLPFCRLYELGYTSLGARALTVPNPLLLRAAVTAAFEEEEQGKYEHADAAEKASVQLAHGNSWGQAKVASGLAPAASASTPLSSSVSGPGTAGNALWCPLTYAAAFQQGVPPAPEPYCPSLAAAAAAAAAATASTAATSQASGVSASGSVSPRVSVSTTVPYLVDSCAYLFHYHTASEARRSVGAAAQQSRAHSHTHSHNGGHGGVGASHVAGGENQEVPPPDSSPNHGNAGADCTALDDSAVAAALAAAAAASAAAAPQQPADARGVVSVAAPPPTPFAHPLLRAVTPASVLWERSPALPAPEACAAAAAAAVGFTSAAAAASAAAREERRVESTGPSGETKGVEEREFEWLCGTYNGPPEPHMPQRLVQAQLNAETATLPAPARSPTAAAAAAAAAAAVTAAGRSPIGDRDRDHDDSAVVVSLASGGGTAVRARWPFAPAWVLRDATYERAGRLQRPKPAHVQSHTLVHSPVAITGGVAATVVTGGAKAEK